MSRPWPSAEEEEPKRLPKGMLWGQGDIKFHMKGEHHVQRQEKDIMLVSKKLRKKKKGEPFNHALLRMLLHLGRVY